MTHIQIAAPGSFANRTVIVTGAAGSIGRPLSIALAKAGANLVVNDLGGSPTGDGASVAAATALANEIRALGYTKVVEDFHSISRSIRATLTPSYRDNNSVRLNTPCQYSVNVLGGAIE